MQKSNQFFAFRLKKHGNTLEHRSFCRAAGGRRQAAKKI